jgi:hypothetical protein
MAVDEPRRGARIPGLGALAAAAILWITPAPVGADAASVESDDPPSTGDASAIETASADTAVVPARAPATVPEPSSLLLFTAGLLLVGGALRVASRN